MNCSARIHQREKIVALIGRTDTGKTSVFNLLTGHDRPVGNRISSTTRQCFTHSNIIDTPGFGDTRGGESTQLSLVDFFISLSTGIDVLLYFVRFGAINSVDLNMFLDVYKRILSVDAYTNSCLVISDYSLPNLEEVNRNNSEDRSNFIRSLHENEKYSYMLNKFEDRLLIIDASPYNKERRDLSREILKNFLRSFQPKRRFNCQNLQDTYRILQQSKELETTCLELNNQIKMLNTKNEQLEKLYEKQIQYCQNLDESYQSSIKRLEDIHQQTLITVENNHMNAVEQMKQEEFALRNEIKQVRKQLEEIGRDMDRSLTFNVASYIPLVNIVTNIIETHTKRRITQRIQQMLYRKRKNL